MLFRSHTPLSNPSSFLSLAIRTKLRLCVVKFSLINMRFDEALAAADALGKSCEKLIFFS